MFKALKVLPFVVRTGFLAHFRALSNCDEVINISGNGKACSCGVEFESIWLAKSVVNQITGFIKEGKTVALFCRGLEIDPKLNLDLEQVLDITIGYGKQIEVEKILGKGSTFYFLIKPLWN